MNIEKAIQQFLIKMGEAVNNTRFDDDTILFYLNKGRRKVARDTRFYAVRDYITATKDAEKEFPLNSSFIDLWDAAEAVTLNGIALVRKTLSDKHSIEELDLQIYPNYIYNGVEGNGYYFKIGHIIYLHPPAKKNDLLEVYGYGYPPEITTTIGVDSAFIEEFADLAILAAVIEAKSDSRKDYSLDRTDYKESIKILKRTRDSDGPRYESLAIR